MGKTVKTKKIKKDPAKCDWLIHNMNKSIKDNFIALTKMKGFKSSAEALTVILNDWNEVEVGKQLWQRLKTSQPKSTK